MKKDDLTEKLGKIIGRLRKEKGISQVELGKLSNTSQMTIQRIEAGSGGTRIEALLAVTMALDIRLVDIFHEVEAGPLKSKILESKWEKLFDQIHQSSPSKKEWVSEILEKVLTPP